MTRHLGAAGLALAVAAGIATAVAPGALRAQTDDGGDQDQYDPMVFALDMTGGFGHGRGLTDEQASRTALDFCDAQGCRVVLEPERARCHALAQYTRDGYWWGVGAAQRLDLARARAFRFCERNAPGECEIDYTYCQ